MKSIARRIVELDVPKVSIQNVNVMHKRLRFHGYKTQQRHEIKVTGADIETY
jgi:hypothetical protein